MFIMANLLIALAQVLDYILWAYWWILLGRVVISWVNADPDNPIVRFLYIATEPVLARVRRIYRFMRAGSIYRRSWFGSQLFSCSVFWFNHSMIWHIRLGRPGVRVLP